MSLMIYLIKNVTIQRVQIFEVTFFIDPLNHGDSSSDFPKQVKGHTVKRTEYPRLVPLRCRIRRTVPMIQLPVISLAAQNGYP